MNPFDDQADLEYRKQEWRLLLTNLLGWSEDQMSDWIGKWCDRLGPDGIGVLMHETAQYYVAPLLVPQEVWLRLSRGESNMLIAMLDGAIRSTDSTPMTSNQFDWRAAKARIDLILSRYR
jgi:hypothetical protein